MGGCCCCSYGGGDGTGGLLTRHHRAVQRARKEAATRPVYDAVRRAVAAAAGDTAAGGSSASASAMHGGGGDTSAGSAAGGDTALCDGNAAGGGGSGYSSSTQQQLAMEVPPPSPVPLIEALLIHVGAGTAPPAPARDTHDRHGYGATAARPQAAAPAAAAAADTDLIDKLCRQGLAALREAVRSAVADTHIRCAGQARLELARLHLTRACGRRESMGPLRGSGDEAAPAAAYNAAVAEEAEARRELERLLERADDVPALRELQEEARRLLSPAELRAIVKEVASREGGVPGGWTGGGHWFRCRNGHPYYIGECGGAMQQGTCPDCGAAVGGGNHAVLAENAQRHPDDARL